MQSVLVLYNSDKFYQTSKYQLYIKKKRQRLIAGVFNERSLQSNKGQGKEKKSDTRS